MKRHMTNDKGRGSGKHWRPAPQFTSMEKNQRRASGAAGRERVAPGGKNGEVDSISRRRIGLIFAAQPPPPAAAAASANGRLEGGDSMLANPFDSRVLK